MNDKQKELIIQYLVSFINWLDGRGLIITDEELIRAQLVDIKYFSVLKAIMEGGGYENAG